MKLCFRNDDKLLGLLSMSQAGVSALPVLDEGGGLVDIYARADITALAAANAYNRLQWEDVTVGQALSLGAVRVYTENTLCPPSRPAHPVRPGLCPISASAHLPTHQHTHAPSTAVHLRQYVSPHWASI